MKTVDAQTTSTLMPYPALLDALRAAALGVAEGQIRCPQRQVVPMGAGGALLSMAAVAPDLAVHKLVTYVPDNAPRSLPAIQGQVSVWDARSGAHVITLDGATVTGRRTAALSMLGVVTLLPRPPRFVHVLGTGTQARHHVEAIASLFPEARVAVSGRTAAAAVKFCAAHAHRPARLAAAPSTAVDPEVDLVISCTTSREPVYEQAARRGRLVIAVGSFTPEAAEIGAETVRASRIYVDDLDSARHEAGDLIRAGIDWAQVVPLARHLRDRTVPDGAALFKTVGHAAWDLAAARVAVAQLAA